MRFILANTTWNSKGWTDVSPDRSGFKWVATDPSKHHGGESWNFRPPRDKWKYGFFENRGNDVRFFADGGIVFFVSKNHADGMRYITGFYARATVFTPQMRSGHWTNLKAWWKDCIKLPNYLPFLPSRHLPPGTKTVRYIAYLKDVQARNILSDMLAIRRRGGSFTGDTTPRLYHIADTYFPGIRPSRLTTGTESPSSVSGSILRRFVAKELPEYTGPFTIRLSKDNAKLQTSYRDHEALKRKVAAYLKGQGYIIKWDKHLDLSARKKRKRIIVEVKSCRPDNIECQVRLGAAQLNYYAFLYRQRLQNAHGMLAIQSRPSDALVKFIVDHCGYDLVFLSGDTLDKA
ncbi:MAG: hypothetical protein NT011_13160 [Kiritimatiellaeota bacterium]|nr:hypothetical protein [Kiritimatiellota bacterium]